ncbi:MAG: threonine-phosphate decarboxylase CobD [Arenibacterium sp.]
MERRATEQSRDHGGNLDQAIAQFGGDMSDWLDLSTGINPVAYPLPEIAAEAWQVLPRSRDMARLLEAATHAYRTTGAIAAFAGAQGAIQAVPRLRPGGDARILAPTYNEHAASLSASGWAVSEVFEPAALCGADLAVVVNPNNPTGDIYSPTQLIDIAKDVGLLLVDESFADPTPELSLAPTLDRHSNILVLRSFGKFYGLAGLRLGFALGSEQLINRLKEIAGPWPVSGPAIEIAVAALQNKAWQTQTITRLGQDATRLDALAAQAGLSLMGGTSLFRTYVAESASCLQDKLAQAHIWSRIFPYSDKWIRLGLPGSDEDWARLSRALQ